MTFMNFSVCVMFLLAGIALGSRDSCVVVLCCWIALGLVIYNILDLLLRLWNAITQPVTQLTNGIIRPVCQFSRVVGNVYTHLGNIFQNCRNQSCDQTPTPFYTVEEQLGYQLINTNDGHSNLCGDGFIHIDKHNHSKTVSIGSPVSVIDDDYVVIEHPNSR